MFKACVSGLGQIGLMYDFELNRTGRPNSHCLAYQQHPSIQLVAGQDLRKEQAGYLKQISSEALFYEDLSEMIKQEQVDIISVCTPPDQHLSAIRNILTLAPPKVIFCEKPVVSNLEEASELKQMLNPSECLFIPNLSRRWNTGVQQMGSVIRSNKYGPMLKIHIRYTRGINNTGSHVFDLLRFLGHKISEVAVLYQVSTSADKENDPSFSFAFETKQGTKGYAEAFNDEYYYLFEMDFFMESAKIEFRMSGDQILILEKGAHPLFIGFHSLHSLHEEKGLLAQSNMASAIDHIARVLNGKESPICTLEDAVYPLYVTDALMKSFQNHSIEQVGDDIP